MRISFGIDGYELRSFRESDVGSLVRYANNAAVARFLRERFPHPYTKRHAVAWIRLTQENRPGTKFAIASPEEVIGGISLQIQTDVYRRSAEVGYWLAESHWGRGIATGALRALADHAFRSFDLIRLYAHVFSPNTPSARVLEKAGFECEGVLRQAVTKDGETMDELVYALLRETWSQRRRSASSS